MAYAGLRVKASIPFIATELFCVPCDRHTVAMGDEDRPHRPLLVWNHFWRRQL